MKLLMNLIFILAIAHWSYAPPVKEEKKENDSEIKDDLGDYMEYHRYLKEVVQVLESDPDFRQELEKADEHDVRSGKIAEKLDFVHHNVRTKLDEIKRRELERLRHLAMKQYELTNDIDTDVGKVPSQEHLDHRNPHTFEIEDLKKLIQKTTADLEVADQKRKEEFKEYEMQKQFENHQKMESMDNTQKKEYQEKLKQEEEAKKNHKPLHHPGSKPQLEEVWEKQDHMDQQFDPKAFFMMHDVDGNGVWDANEVKALFISELNKIYSPNGPNKDLNERAEEMERMREHVFKENDKNRDGLIDFSEFVAETQRADFNQDAGWDSLMDNELYSQQEYEAFERQRLEEIKYLQQRGLVDAYGRPVPGAEHQIQQAHQQFLAWHHQEAEQNFQPQHHGQAPMYPQGQMPPQGYQQQSYQGQHQAQPQQVPHQPQYSGQAPSQGQYQTQQQAQVQAQHGNVNHAQVPPQYQGQAAPQLYQNKNQQGQAQPVQAQAPLVQNLAVPVQGQAQPAQSQTQSSPQGQAQSAQGQVPPAQRQPLSAQGQAPPAQGQVPPSEAQGLHSNIGGQN